MKILQQLKKLSLATIIIGFISGILFISYPDKCIKYISIAVGAAFIGIAIAAIVGYLIDKTSTFSLVTGILLGIVGVIICARYRQVISFIVVIIGIFIIGAGITNLITGLKTISRSVFFGWTTLLLSAATIVFGVIAVLNSSGLTESLVRLIGIGLIIYAVMDLIAYFEVRSIAKEIKQAVDAAQDIETDGVIVEAAEETNHIEE